MAAARRRRYTQPTPSPALLYRPPETPPDPKTVGRFFEFDQLPADVRKAVNECPYYIRIRPGYGKGWATCIEEIMAISDYVEAEAFTKKWTR